MAPLSLYAEHRISTLLGNRPWVSGARMASNTTNRVSILGKLPHFDAYLLILYWGVPSAVISWGARIGKLCDCAYSSILFTSSLKIMSGLQDRTHFPEATLMPTSLAWDRPPLKF